MGNEVIKTKVYLRLKHALLRCNWLPKNLVRFGSFIDWEFVRLVHATERVRQPTIMPVK